MKSNRFPSNVVKWGSPTALAVFLHGGRCRIRIIIRKNESDQKKEDTYFGANNFPISTNAGVTSLLEGISRLVDFPPEKARTSFL